MGSEGKRSSQMLNVRDDLLLDLLASEAVVDSRGCQILSAEEVEELKKVRSIIHAYAVDSPPLLPISRNNKSWRHVSSR